MAKAEKKDTPERANSRPVFEIPWDGPPDTEPRVILTGVPVLPLEWMLRWALMGMAPATSASATSLPVEPVETPAPVATPEKFYSTRDCAVAMARRMKSSDEVHDGMMKTIFAKKLTERINDAFKSGAAPKGVCFEYVMRQLTAWGLWPISSIK
jgi:hypothetical protein